MSAMTPAQEKKLPTQLEKLRDELAKDAIATFKAALCCVDIEMVECIPVISNKSFNAGASEAFKMLESIEVPCKCEFIKAIEAIRKAMGEGE